MLTTKVLGTDLSAVATAHPLYYSGIGRQVWESHIAVGVQDVTPGPGFGYDWQCVVVAYRAWSPGRHGTSCAVCADVIALDRWCPAGAQCGHLQDGAYYDSGWGQTHTESFAVKTTADAVAGRRYDPDRLTAAIQAADAALTALPPTALTWTAYGPHDYGHWARREDACDWLIGHMHALARDPNLGAERQAAARDGARLLRSGSSTVTVGAKTYGIRRLATTG